MRRKCLSKNIASIVLAASLITNVSPMGVLADEINNSNRKINNAEEAKDLANKEVEKENIKVERAMKPEDIVKVEPTKELPFTEIGMRDRGDIWEEDQIDIEAKLNDSENISKIEVKYRGISDDNRPEGEYILEMVKNPYKDKFENPRIKTDIEYSEIKNYRAKEIIFYGKDNSIKIVKRSTDNKEIFKNFDYKINKHEIKDIELIKNDVVTEGDIVQVKIDISGSHKLERINSYFENSGGIKDIKFDEKEGKFIGDLHIEKADNYKFSSIDIYKKYNHRYVFLKNEELFNKKSFTATKYFYPIENIEVENKENIKYFDKVKIKAKLFDKAKASEIEEIIVHYMMHDGQVKLTQDSDNIFSGELKSVTRGEEPYEINIKKDGGTYVTFNKDEIEVKEHLEKLSLKDIEFKLPFESIEIENKQDEYYQGDSVKIKVKNPSENLDMVEISYDNGEHFYGNKDESGNLVINRELRRDGDYKIKDIHILNNESPIRIDVTNKIPKEKLKELEFNVKPANPDRPDKPINLPITSIEMEKKEDVKLLEKIKVNAKVTDNDIEQIKLVTMKTGRVITLDKLSDNTFSGELKAKFKNEQVFQIVVVKNGEEIWFSPGEVQKFSNSISLSDINLPFKDLEIKKNKEVQIGDKIGIKAEGVEKNISKIVVDYNTGKEVELNEKNTFENTFDVNRELNIVDNLVVYDKDGESMRVGRYSEEDMLSKLDFAARPKVAVEKVTLNKSEISLKSGWSEKLVATVTPNNVTNKEVEWTSSDLKVATVDKDGKVVAVGEGTAIITVKTKDGNKEATCKVTVRREERPTERPPVVSNKKPVINAEDVTIKAGDKFDPLKNVSATDKEDGEIKNIKVVENTVDISKAGTYKVVYEVRDTDGNTVRKEIKVTVKSNEKPVIKAEDVTIKVGDKFDPLKNVSATDKEDGEIKDIKVVENTVDTSKAGTYKVVYEVTDKDGNTVRKEIKVTVKADEKPVAKGNVIYQTHVQDYGWQDWNSNGEMSGTSGQGKRLEGIRIKISDMIPGASIKYRTHIQDYGWQDWKADGELSGTEGKGKRLEGVEIKLENAPGYSVEYRTHVQDYGWQDWKRNGEMSGTSGKAKRLEGIEIRIVKDDSAKVEYRTHIQDYGWQDWKNNGQMSGTEGKAKRLEGIEIKATNLPKGASIVYRTHVQDYGWQDWKRNGEMSGTSGKAKRLEGIEIKLENAPGYSVEYRTHVQDYGWQDWKRNGEMSGTEGQAKRLEGIEIRIVKK